jgi:hypothetical protein
VSRVFDVLLKNTKEIDRISKEISDIESKDGESNKGLTKTRAILERYRERIGLLGYDVHFVLNSNLYALKRDGRITLPELLSKGGEGDRALVEKLPS